MILSQFSETRISLSFFRSLECIMRDCLLQIFVSVTHSTQERTSSLATLRFLPRMSISRTTDRSFMTFVTRFPTTASNGNLRSLETPGNRGNMTLNNQKKGKLMKIIEYLSFDGLNIAIKRSLDAKSLVPECHAKSL